MSVSVRTYRTFPPMLKSNENAASPAQRQKHSVLEDTSTRHQYIEDEE